MKKQIILFISLFKATALFAQTNTGFFKVLQDAHGNILVLARAQSGSSDITLLKYSSSGSLLHRNLILTTGFILLK